MRRRRVFMGSEAAPMSKQPKKKPVVTGGNPDWLLSQLNEVIMNQIVDESNEKPLTIFGYLYMAVFSNGTVKAGMSRNEPQARVICHAHAGKAFGISMESSFFSCIYTDDVRQREKLMHLEILRFAPITSGREWFMFPSLASALNFASTYLYRVERMSFAERPTSAEVKAGLEKKERTIGNFFDFVDEKNRNSKEASEIAEAEIIIASLDNSTVIHLARNILNLNDIYCADSEDFSSGMPKLTDQIDEYYDDRYTSTGCESQVSSKTDTEHAREIISAAMLYRNFFYEACTMRSVEAGPV